MSRLLAILFACAALAPITALAQQRSACRATLAQFDRIGEGMTYPQVKQVVGCEGLESGRTEGGGRSTAMYSWDGQDAIASLTVLFVNGRVYSKAHYGLR